MVFSGIFHGNAQGVKPRPWHWFCWWNVWSLPALPAAAPQMMAESSKVWPWPWDMWDAVQRKATGMYDQVQSDVSIHRHIICLYANILYINIYIYIYLHTHTHIYICIYIYLRIYIYIYSYIYTYIYTYIFI